MTEKHSLQVTPIYTDPYYKSDKSPSPHPPPPQSAPPSSRTIIIQTGVSFLGSSPQQLSKIAFHF